MLLFSRRDRVQKSWRWGSLAARTAPRSFPTFADQTHGRMKSIKIHFAVAELTSIRLPYCRRAWRG